MPKVIQGLDLSFNLHLLIFNFNRKRNLEQNFLHQIFSIREPGPLINIRFNAWNITNMLGDYGGSQITHVWINNIWKYIYKRVRMASYSGWL